MSPGIDLRYDAIEGYDEAASEVMPHAWQAGEQSWLNLSIERQDTGVDLRVTPDVLSDGAVRIALELEVSDVGASPIRCRHGDPERRNLRSSAPASASELRRDTP